MEKAMQGLNHSVMIQESAAQPALGADAAFGGAAQAGR